MNEQKFIPEGWNEIEKEYTLKELNDAILNHNVLESTVKGFDKSNAYVSLCKGVTGIIPKEELGIYNKKNKYVKFEVVGKNYEGFTLSRRKVQKDSLDWAINELETGKTVNGIVRNIQPYGAFVEIGGGTVGLLHIEDISIARMKTPEERLHVGQKIPVIIKNIDKKEKKLNLSYKEFLGSWKDNVKDIVEGQKLQGIIRETSKDKRGLFIELKPNLVGMAEYKPNYEYGEKVKVIVKRIIPEKEKIKLKIVKENAVNRDTSC